MIRLAVRCTPELAERVLAELVELAPGGVEEERGDGYVEYAIYGPPGEVPELPDLEAAAGEGLVEIETTEIPDDWADRWRDFHEPVVVGGGRLVVRPSWEAAAARGTEIDIVVDPGRAFGTGAHATTRACLELLLELAECGRGPGRAGGLGDGLGGARDRGGQARLGPRRSRATTRPAAIEAAAANAKANGVEIELERVNLRESAPPRRADGGGEPHSPRCWSSWLPASRPAAIERPATMVLSGLLAGEAERVASAWSAAGLAVAAERVERGVGGAPAAQPSEAPPRGDRSRP